MQFQINNNKSKDFFLFFYCFEDIHLHKFALHNSFFHTWLVTLDMTHISQILSFRELYFLLFLNFQKYSLCFFLFHCFSLRSIWSNDLLKGSYSHCLSYSCIYFLRSFTKISLFSSKHAHSKHLKLLQILLKNHSYHQMQSIRSSCLSYWPNTSLNQTIRQNWNFQEFF